MNWKKWKVGLFIAILTGIATAGAVGVIVPTATWKQLGFILFGFICKDLGLYLKDHSIDSISFDTTTITKNENKTPTNP